MPFLTSNVVRLTVGGDVSSASTVELRWSEIKVGVVRLNMLRNH